MKQSFDYRSEQRQHIALSQYAYNIISNDSIMFLGKENISGIINRVFLNYYQDSKASISINAQIYQDHFANLFNSVGSTEVTRLIGIIKKDYCDETKRVLNRYAKDVPLKIRLNNDVYDILFSTSWEDDSWPESPYFKNRGLYLKAVIEDYAHLPLFEREKIYFKGFIDIVNNELDRQTERKRILQLDYVSATNQTWHFNIKPFAILGDKDRNYNYLVGYSCKAGTDDEYKPGAFRLSRILSIHPHGSSFGSGKISKENEKFLIDQIEEKGVQFLIQRQEDIVVKLTAKGRKMFNSQLYLRPVPINKETKILEDGGMELHFYATKDQITFYFFKFGKEAHIVSPQYLTESFMNQYKEAYESYSDNQ